MPTFKQKNVIKSYKLRLQEKLKTVSEETENATVFLNNCVAEFRNRVQHILEIKDEKCLSLYRKLIRDLENYSEKIFILQASLEEVTEEESDSSEDESSVNASKEQQQRTSSSLSSTNENASLDLQIDETTHSTACTEQNVNQQTYPKEIFNSAENLNLTNFHEECSDQKRNQKENLNLPSYTEEKLCSYFDENLKFNSYNHSVVDDDDGGSITEDDFYSLHSDNNILNINNNASVDTPFEIYDYQSISASDYTSNISASQNSCYRSISSSIGESLSFPKDSKPVSSFKTHSLDADQEYSLEKFLVKPTPKIPNVKFEISSRFSATLSHIIDPSDFWIQIENSHSSELRFSKSHYAQLSSLLSIKKGSWCLAPFKSSPFYFRAKSFSDANSGTELVKVLFIDHGSYQDVPLSELRPLPKSAFDIPAQAINCYLYGIASKTDSWSVASIERFKEFQNYCIETVVKSKEFAYGVQLIAKLSADSFSDDFSVDVAQALCLDGFAISLIESPSCANNQKFQSASQVAKPEYNKTDSSLEVSGSYDINAISSDSGVSVTSSYKSSQISHKKDEIFAKVSRECVSPIPIKNVPLLYDKNLNSLDHDLQMQNLISFESYEVLNESRNSSKEITSIKKIPSQNCLVCNSGPYCLHLKVPSPTLMFVKEDMVVVMLSHIVNPHEFYVNMAMENIMTLDELREQMTHTYEKEKKIPCIRISNLVEGMHCAGRYDADNYWYRVKILKIEDRENDQVLGQYIDYGNTAKIKCCNLRPLTKEFSKHPCFAIKCSLAGIKPVEESNWSEEAVNIFKELTSYERCLTAQICNELCKDDVYSVLLWDTDNSEDLLINTSLADNKVAVLDSQFFQPPSSSAAFKATIDSWDPMLEEYIDSRNSYAVDDEDIEVATTGYHAKDEQYTCKYYALRGYCPRGSNCNFEHLPLLESGITRDQEEVYCLESSPITENVSNLLVQVSAIITPFNFYVVLPFGCKTVDDLDSLVYKGASYDEIINSEAKALFYAIDKHYANTPFQENTTVALSCGTVVAAKRKWDEKWHRGKIVDVLDVDKPAKVFFVDSGDQEWVPRKCIRTILPQFLHTPFQAVLCSLHGIKPVDSKNGSSWSSDAMNYFREIVSGEILLAEIIGRYGLTYEVSLRKTSRSDHGTITQHLVSAGYAQYLKVTVKPPETNVKRVMYVPG